VFYWLPAFIWLGMVGIFSGELFSARNTGGVLLRILACLHIQVSVGTLNALHFAIRKGMHFFAYGVLSALYFRAFRGPGPQLQWKAQWVGAALIICMATASLDEWHQGMTPGRGGSWWDVLLDMCGALFVQLLILAWYWRRPGRRAPTR